MPRPIANPPNPWSSTHVEWLGEAPPASLEIFEERARSILARNESPDVPFRWSVNPYRGCLHACAYCYARPSHQYLGFGAGTDFDRKIVVKVNAPELLERAFAAPSWRGESVTFSGNTDCYQGLEANYALTRRCLEVCLAYRNPVAVITKGALVRRDVDLLAALAREARASVAVSIPFADDADARKIEPYASAITQRFETLRVLADAGVPVAVAIAPVIPGLNDHAIPAILERARAAGARRAFVALVRLAGEVRPVFESRLDEAFPLRARKVKLLLAQAREGQASPGQFGTRMVGQGAHWDAVRALFELHARRLGFDPGHDTAEPATTFRRPTVQGRLFD